MASRPLRLALAALALLLLVLFGRELAGHIPSFARWVEAQGATGVVVFVLMYVVATVAFVPGVLLTLAAGAIWGLAAGTAIVFAGATLGSTTAFLVARSLSRSGSRGLRMVEARTGRFARTLQAIDTAVSERGRTIVLLLRLSPAVPYNLLNYALGLTRVSLRDYLFAAVGMLPGTLLYVYYGKVAGDVAAAASGMGTQQDARYWIVLTVGLLATVLATILITRAAKRALDNA